jgi:hypothetical protein
MRETKDAIYATGGGIGKKCTFIVCQVCVQCHISYLILQTNPEVSGVSFSIFVNEKIEV